jgi:hypothetical protein
MKNLQNGTEIRTKKRLKIIRRLFREKNPVGFHPEPMRDRDRQSTLHAGKASPQIVQLTRERRLKNPFENLFVAELQCLLESLLGIKGSKARMFVSATGKIPQRSDVSQTGK